jgi:pteridine reductase
MHQLAFISGAAMRLGESMTRHLAAKGWNVAIHFNRSSDKAAALAEELRLHFPNQQFEIFQADLSSGEETEALIPTVIKKMGLPSLLINNASVFGPSSIKNTSSTLFDQQILVNLRAPFLLTRDFANLCKQGIIINLTDTRITTNKTGHAAYTLAKKSLWELTKMSALELGPSIRVNAIAPGLTLAPAEEGDEYLWRLAENIPMKRPGGVDPILKSLDFILDNDYLTGQLLFGDGGENLGT